MSLTCLNSVQKLSYMSWETIFWDTIGKDIETKFEMGHPKSWDESAITVFQSKMDAILKELCLADKKKIELCNYKRKKNVFDLKYQAPVSSRTFKRIFQGKGNTKKTTEFIKNRFSLLFGASSYTDYLEKNSILENLKAETEIEEQTNDDKIKAISQEINKSIYIQNQHHLKYIQSFNKLYFLKDIYIQPQLVSDFNEVYVAKLEDLMKKNTKIVIHADSFTGKSTLLKYLALTSNEKMNLLFLPLAEYRGDLIALVEITYEISKEKAEELTLKNENTVLLLDAFDEISNPNDRVVLANQLAANNIYKFILTSRSKFLVDIKIPASLFIKIENYKLDDVHLLVDKYFNATGTIISFYNSLRVGTNYNEDLEVLKFPWLVIFIMEHYTDGRELSHNFFTNLGLRIFDAIQRKMWQNRGYSKLDVQHLSKDIGGILYPFWNHNSEEDIVIEEGLLSSDQIRFLDELVHFGIINVVSILNEGSKRYLFTVPLVSQTFIANWIASMDTKALSMALSSIYFEPSFKKILAYSAAIMASRGQKIDIFFHRNHLQLPDGINNINPFYEKFMILFILKHLPKGSFIKKNSLLPLSLEINFNIHKHLIEFYKTIGYFLKKNLASERFENMMLTKKNEDILNYNIYNAVEEKMMDYVTFLSEKNEKLRDKFWEEIERIEYANLHVNYELKIQRIRKSFVQTPSFHKKLFKLIKAKDIKRDDYVTALASSPFKAPEINEQMWQSVRPLQFLTNFNPVRNNISLQGTSPENDLWDEHLDVFYYIILLLRKGDVTNEEVSILFSCLSCYIAMPEEIKVFRFHMGKFKSIRLAEDLANFMLSILKRDEPLRRYSSLYSLTSNYTLFLEENLEMNSILLKIMDELIKICSNIEHILTTKSVEQNRQELMASLVSEDINIFLNYFLGLKKISIIKQKVEELFERLLHLKLLGLKVSKFAFNYMIAYLINLESKALLDTIATNEFCRTTLINNLSHCIDNSDTWQNILPSSDFLHELVQTFQKSNSLELSSIKKITATLQEILWSNNKGKSKPINKYMNHISKFEEENDMYELSQACKYQAFEEYISKNPKMKYSKYALLHAIYTEKPLFLKEDATYPYFYSLKSLLNEY